MVAGAPNKRRTVVLDQEGKVLFIEGDGKTSCLVS